MCACVHRVGVAITTTANMKVPEMDSRGSPSAISIAVIPRDHWSLCVKSMMQNQIEERVGCVRVEGSYGRAAATSMRLAHPVVVSCCWVLVTGNDLRCHPVRRTNECIAFANGSVQLGRHTKVHCKGRKAHTRTTTD